MANRMVDAARGVLNSLLADVYIFTDHRSGPEGGLSPGYGISLVAETTSGCFLTAEVAKGRAVDADDEGEEMERGGGGEGEGGAGGEGSGVVVPEDLGLRAAQCLLEEVQRGGVLDSCHQVCGFPFPCSSPIAAWSSPCLPCASQCSVSIWCTGAYECNLTKRV